MNKLKSEALVKDDTLEDIKPAEVLVDIIKIKTFYRTSDQQWDMSETYTKASELKLFYVHQIWGSIDESIKDEDALFVFSNTILQEDAIRDLSKAGLNKHTQEGADFWEATSVSELCTKLKAESKATIKG